MPGEAIWTGSPSLLPAGGNVEGLSSLCVLCARDAGTWLAYRFSVLPPGNSPLYILGARTAVLVFASISIYM